MKARIAAVGLGTALTLALVPGAMSAPNQGNPSMVLKVDNKHVWCKYPTPGKKVEGKFGRTIHVSSKSPIDFVTVKSGSGAYVVSSWFDTYKGKITLSKDVSNYVVWTCPKKY